VTQQALGEEQDELVKSVSDTLKNGHSILCYRFSKVAMDLATKNMELGNLLLVKVTGTSRISYVVRRRTRGSC
jgi:hypothetical protein